MSEKKRITLYENKNQIVSAAVDKIVVEIIGKRQDEKNQSIVLFGASPLSGTTTTSIELSIAMAVTGRRTLLMDCDVRKSQQYKKLNEKVDCGLADYLLGDCSVMLEDILYETNVENLSYMPCGKCEINATRIMSSPQMSQLINSVKDRFDCIIYDLPSLAIVPDAQLLFNSASGIIMLVALGETSKKQLKDAKRKIKPFYDKYYGMIINKVESKIYKRRVKNYGYYLEDKKGNQILAGSAIVKDYQKKANRNKKGEKK